MLEEKTGYQFRVTNPAKNKCIDIYPIHYRWHDLSNNTRGQVKGDAGLKSLIISKLISNGNGKEGKPKKKKPRRKKFKKYGKKPYAARTRLERPKDIPE